MFHEAAESKEIERALSDGRDPFRITEDYASNRVYRLYLRRNFTNTLSPCKRTSKYYQDDIIKIIRLLKEIVYSEGHNIFSRHNHKAKGEVQPIDFRIIVRENRARWIYHGYQLSCIFAGDL